MKEPAPNVKVAQPLPRPQPYTVLLLRPDTDWDGVPANWVSRMHVEAMDVGDAIGVAVPEAIREYYSNPDGTAQIGNDALAVLAVFPGHVADLYDPEGE